MQSLKRLTKESRARLYHLLSDEDMLIGLKTHGTDRIEWEHKMADKYYGVKI